MMERALKERIIGATVLVIIVVLIVPVFLDGPPADGETVSERVLLPGQKDQDIKTVVLERERSEPMPAVSSVQAEEKKPVPQPLVRRTPTRTEAPPESSPTPSPTPSPTVATAVAETTGMWAVQLGSFLNKQNAEKLAADLRKQDYAAFLSQVVTSSGKLHRVRVGPQKDRASAEAMAARLLKAGHKGQVLPHP